MTIASAILAKASNNPYTEAAVASAEKFLEIGQSKLVVAKTMLNSVKEENTIRISKLAQKNLLAMAKRADQLSVSLTELSEKLEPATKPVAKSAKKPAVKKAAVKAPAVKAAAVKAPVVKAALKAAKPAAPKAVKAVKPVEVVAPVAMAA